MRTCSRAKHKRKRRARSILLYGGGLGEPNEHAVIDLPNLVLGGGAGRIDGGQHLTYPIDDYVPQANLLISLLGKAGGGYRWSGSETARVNSQSWVSPRVCQASNRGRR